MSDLEKYLKDLGEQENQEENKLKIVQTPELVQLCEKFEEFLKLKYDPTETDEDERNYDLARDLVREIKYTAKDVLSFSIKMKEYENKESFQILTGVFLSALINSSKEENFNIITEHLSKQLGFLGYKNKKNVEIIGNAGDGFGINSISGRMIITGDAGIYCGGYMTGGELIVQGNADDLIGPEMTGGIIRIKKNAKGWVGTHSKGGEIHVEGELERMVKGRLSINKHKTTKAKIFHKGVQIWPE